MRNHRESITEKDRGFLKKVSNTALKEFRYSWGVKIFEKFFKENPEYFDELILSDMAILYDHLALKQKSQAKKKFYENRAIGIHKNILNKNPKSENATWGIGRILWHHNDEKALHYALKARRLSIKRDPNNPSKGIITQTIGLVYNAVNDKKNAARWLLRGAKESPHMWPLHSNLVEFYIASKNITKLKIHLGKLVSLFEKENEIIKNSAWGERTKKLIKKAGGIIK